MKKEEEFTDDFLDLITNGQELQSFLEVIQKRGIEKLLEAELDGHLDYENTKNQIIQMLEMGISQKRLNPLLENR